MPKWNVSVHKNGKTIVETVLPGDISQEQAWSMVERMAGKQKNVICIMSKIPDIKEQPENE